MAFNRNLSDWEAFLAAWPVERLKHMTLAEYTTAGDENCFVYWLEQRLREYGSIRGGSAFKFGIYSRKSTENGPIKDTHMRGDGYAWHKKLGYDPKTAFNTVRKHIVKVAEGSKAGYFDCIDGNNLNIGQGFLSKVAFHYQKRHSPGLVCVFRKQTLLAFLGLPERDRTPLSRLHHLALQSRRNRESLIDFSERVWKAAPYRVTLSESAINKGYLTIRDISLSPFDESVMGGGTEYEVRETARFSTDTGWQFESDIRTIGKTLGHIRTRLDRYFSQKKAKPGDQIQIDIQDDGSYLLIHIPQGGLPPITKTSASSIESILPQPTMTNIPLNQILYGPPGTGKTYATIDHALAILEPGFKGPRAELKKKFDAYAADGKIRFITFHQSFSYEDFVEGLTADTDEGMIRYDIKNGVFKQLCMDADGVSKAAEASGIRKDATIWKLSIEGTGESATRNYCFEHSEARIGWGYIGDLASPELLDHPNYKELGFNDKSSLENFSVAAEIGDVILCIGTRNTFQAIGVVQGTYHFEESPPSGVRKDYKNVLPVRWLVRNMDIDIKELNASKGFTLKTMYELGRINWQDVEGLLERNRITLNHRAEKPGEEHKQPHVLVIDEINRGNLSRIFGELITLIEPSKRKGADDALEVTLPYSKKKFSVPDNVYLIGTMNTADRSLAGLDIALRRRFRFVAMPPRPEVLAQHVVAGIDLQAMLQILNRRIEVLLGRDYLLGHAYFMGVNTLAELADVFRLQVLPLLQEYFFEDWQRIAWVLNDHAKTVDAHKFLKKEVANSADVFGAGADLPDINDLWHVNNTAFEHVESYTGIININ